MELKNNQLAYLDNEFSSNAKRVMKDIINEMKDNSYNSIKNAVYKILIDTSDLYIISKFFNLDFDNYEEYDELLDIVTNEIIHIIYIED